MTAGGVVFIGAAMDRYLRAFNAETGAELWQGKLPAGGQATPMTYVHEGRQYVVIAAGGHRDMGTKKGDYVLAFALPRDGDKRPAPLSRALGKPGGVFRLTLVFIALGLLILAVGVAYVLRRR